MMPATRCPECKKIVPPQSIRGTGDNPCPHCGKPLHPGARVGLWRRTPDTEAPAAETGRHYRKPNGTNVSLVRSALLGAVLTCAVYLVVSTPLSGTYVHALLTQRGWVQYAIILLACWGVAMLLFKYRKICRQRATLLLDVLPTRLGEDIGPDNAGRFRDHLRTLGCDADHNFLVRRIARALDRCEQGQDLEEIAGLLKSHAEIDACSVQSSYTILKVIIWAIPIFGFLGTVLGIGTAVQQFSGSLQGIQAGGQITTLLGPVITGLAMAFDTTLLALLMSLIVMFPTSWLEKMEDDLLIAIDEYCHDRLLGRLQAKREPQVAPQESFQSAASELLQQHQAQMETWSVKLATVGAEICARIVQGWEPVHQKMCEAQEASLRRIQEVSSGLARGQMELAAQVQAVQEGQVGRFQDVLAALTEDLRNLQEQTHQGAREEIAVIQGMAHQLGETLSGLKEEAQTVQDTLLSHFQNVAGVFGEGMQSLQDRMHKDCLGQTKAAREVAGQLSEVFSRVKEEAQAMHDALVAQSKEAVAALAEDMRRWQAQTQEKHQEEVTTTRDMANQVRETLVGLKDEAKALQTGIGRTVADCQEVFGHLQQVCLTWATQLESMETRRAQAEASQESLARSLVDRMARERVLAWKAMQDQLEQMARVQQQALMAFTGSQEALRDEIHRFAEIQQRTCQGLEHRAPLQGPRENQTQILARAGLPSGPPHRRKARAERQPVLSSAAGTSPRRGILQWLWKGNGNGSHE
jgi:biopolymer transport protein ExbB/TolQ